MRPLLFCKGVRGLCSVPVKFGMLTVRTREALKIKGGRVHYPEPALCTDNVAMIAFAGALRLAAGEALGGEPAVRIRPRWPLAELQPPQPARQ